MAYTDINSEDRLVQATFASHLRERLGWESAYAWNAEGFGVPPATPRPALHAPVADGTPVFLGRESTSEVVLKWDLRTALVRLNPQLPAAAVAEAVATLTRHDVSRSLLQHNQEFHGYLRDGVPVRYRDAQGQWRHARARVLDFQNGRGPDGRVVELPRHEAMDADPLPVVQGLETAASAETLELVEPVHPDLGKLGVFWHTQGSGKSYSMAFFAEKVRRQISARFTFLLVTDREDLDSQIYRTFVGCSVADEKTPRAASGEDLKRLLQENHRYVFSLIHKFNQDVDPTAPYSTRDDIIVISDEAHRTQAGKLARNLRLALPNAAFIGFTGTPLFRNDHLTRRIFGTYVSRYDVKRSAEDGATTKLVYEVITADDRLDRIADGFVAHCAARWESGKCMLVYIDKITCGRMADGIRRRRPVRTVIAPLEQWTGKEQTKAIVQTDILDQVFALLPHRRSRTPRNRPWRRASTSMYGSRVLPGCGPPVRRPSRGHPEEKPMTARERVLTTLQHREPDRVPFNLRPSEGMRQRLRTELNDPSVDFADHFGHDLRYVYVPLAPRPEGVPEPDWTPLPSAGDIAACAGRTAALQARGLAVCSGYACGVFEQAKHWLGDAGALTMPYDEPARLAGILDRIAAWKTAVYAAYVEAGVDIVWIGDDLGGQRALVMSPQHYRDWYRPRHERIVTHLRRLRPGVRIAFHCCGHVTPLIPDLLEIGIDILEAVQAEAMDLAFLKREFGRDLSFWGGVGAQSVLARTTPAQVREGVRQTLRVMAPGGGYLAAPCHTLTEEVAWAGVLAFHDALRDFGTYPRSEA